MRKQLMFLFFSTLSLSCFAQNNPLWLRYPAISPDGKTIVFGYKGDLYKVSASGGNAVALTLHEAQDEMPVWSHDGKQIAFASDRYGNFDVYVMPSEGGEATRLTYNSTNDFPWDFSVDNKQVIFGSGRNDLNTSLRFPNKALFQKLYQVPINGGRSILLLTAGSENVHYNSKGDAIVFQDRKGYEDPWRKHHTSSVTRDIWTYDFKTKEYKKISTFEGEDREPVYASDDKSVYYLSEKNGAQNIFKVVLSNIADAKQLTSFKDNPVRHLSRANDNTLCFSWNGEIYTLKDGGKPEKVNIVINADSKSNTEKIVSINGGATEMSVSPNGKEIAFVFRGEVFVTSVEGGITKRITNTSQQERMIAFAPDGKTLYYSAERNGSWDIMKATIARKEEPYFYASTVIKEEPLIATEKEEFQPKVSPDGKEIAYLEERNTLKIFNIEKKTSRTILPAGQNFSYSDGDQNFSWSPDGKWIAVKSAKGNFALGGGDIVLFKADGTDNKGTDVTNSGFSESNQQWAFGGKAILYTSDKYGKKPLAIQGPRETDVFIEFFDKDVYDRFKLNKDDAALQKEKDDKEKKDTSKKKEDIVLDLNNLEERRIRLTNGSLNLADYTLSFDGSKLFFLARFEQGFDLWQSDTKTREVKLVTKLGAGGGNMELSKDGKSLFVIADGRLTKVEVDAGKVSPVIINGEMVLNTAGERAYIFQHAWTQVKKKFYDTKLHGVDWEMYKKNYERFLPHINNNYDFQELLSEILGELNASHTGGRYSPQNPNGDITASLGLFYDETVGGNGLKVTEVITNGPVDNAKSKIKSGTIIEKIDGEEITDATDWNKFLNRKAGKNVLLSLSNGTDKWEEVIKPISPLEENALLYKRWTKTMADMVEKLSGGKVGYVHVQGMNDGAYRDVFEQVFGKNGDKEALIVDTRFNGGGWLHDDLVTFLKGKQYLTFAPYGFKSGGGEPVGKWTKPSTVLMSESNYSDAFIFPYAYRANGVGKLIGKPVPGTGTAVWWETQIDPTLVFGIPMIATIGAEKRPTENLQINPDIDVDNPYKNVLFGKDDQLEAAVKEMLKVIGGK
ncbi:MAG: peptidase S41 [Chitinophaga sp.]|jgi:tricorn protease|nr:peptidase S41 [Chitinophaga sp.]